VVEIGDDEADVEAVRGGVDAGDRPLGTNAVGGFVDY